MRKRTFDAMASQAIYEYADPNGLDLEAAIVKQLRKAFAAGKRAKRLKCLKRRKSGGKG